MMKRELVRLETGETRLTEFEQVGECRLPNTDAKGFNRSSSISLIRSPKSCSVPTAAILFHESTPRRVQKARDGEAISKFRED